jgi:hypothetical protein
MTRTTEPPIPTPIKAGGGRFGHNFYRYVDVVHYIDAMAGQAPRELEGDDLIRLITENKFRELLGGVSKMFIHRRRIPKGSAPEARA